MNNQQFDKEEDNKYLKQVNKSYYDGQDSEITKYLLEMEKVIQSLLLHYSGYVFDPYTGKGTYNPKLKLMNTAGVQYANRKMRLYLHKGGALANLNKQQIESQIMHFSSRVRQDLLHFREEFDIHSIATIREVKNDIVDLAFLQLSRSLDDKERQYINDSRKVVEHRQFADTTPDKKKLKIGW